MKKSACKPTRHFSFGGEIDPTQVDMQAIKAGTVDPNGSDYNTINAEKTLRWAAEDAAKAQQYRQPFQPTMAATSLGQGLSAMAKAPAASQPIGTTFQQDSDARQSRINGLRTGLTGMERRGRANGLMGSSSSLPSIGFADGGKIDAEELMRQMSAKYGAPAAGPTTQPPVQQAPQPKPQAPAQQQPQGIIGLIRNRGVQIDKAVNGYRNGGKIKGPGTPTSDSIAAEVIETKEPIRVANEERIVSAAQDKVLESLAQKMGYDNLDQMLEVETGKPVGPTIKGGVAAAAGGRPPTEETLHNGPYTEDGGSIVKDFKDWQANKIAQTSAKIDAGMAMQGISKAAKPASVSTAQQLPQASYSNEGRSVPTKITAPDQRPVVPGIGPQAINLPQDLTTKDVVPGGYLDRGAGIIASRNKNGQLNVSNVGTADIANMSKGVVDGSESALIDQKNSTYNPARQLANMQRLRLETDAFDPTITDPNVRDSARAQLAVLDKNQQAQTENEIMRRKLFNPLDEQAKQLDIKSKEGSLAKEAALSGLIAKLNDPKLSAEERSSLRANILAAQGKNPNEHRYFVGEDETTDPTGSRSKRAVLLDATAPGGRAGQQGDRVPTFASTAEAQAAMRAGKIKSGDVINTPAGQIRVK